MTDSAMQRQFELSDGCGATLVCWLEDRKTLRKNVRLTLKETGDRVWRIEQRFQTTRSVSNEIFSRGWKVGGLE